MKVAVMIVIIIGIALGLYTVIDYPYRQRYAVVYNELMRVQREVIEPAGGIAHNKIYSTGQGWLDSMDCIDISCPSVRRQWLVPIPADRVEGLKLLNSILTRFGYQLIDDEVGVKGKIHMSIFTDPVGGFPVPYPAPVGKQWLFVRVDVYE